MMKLNKQTDRTQRKHKRKTESKLKNVIVITYRSDTLFLQSVYCEGRKNLNLKSNINKWNNKTIEIGCFDIEKTCTYLRLGKERGGEKEGNKKEEEEEDYLKWLDKNMLTLTFDSKITKRSLIQLNSSSQMRQKQQQQQTFLNNTIT